MKKRDYTANKRSRRSLSDSESQGRGSRSQRLATRRRARRKRTVAAILAAGLIISVMVFLSVYLLSRSNEPGPESLPEEIAGYGAVMVVVVGEDGNLNQLMVVATGDDGSGNVYPIPSRTLVEAEGAGFQRVDRVFALGGHELLMKSLGDLLLTSIDSYIVLDQKALDVLASAANAINFRTAEPLSFISSEVELSAGDNLTAPDLALSYLQASADEPEWGPFVQALFYEGVHEVIAAMQESERKAIAEDLAGLIEKGVDESDFITLFLALTAAESPVTFRQVPVVAKGQGEEWYFEPLPDQIETMLKASAAQVEVSMEIKNGTEAAGIVEAAAAKLEPLGYNMVVDTEASNVNYDNTQIRCGSDALEACNNIRELLGRGTMIKDEYLDKNKVIVIIGRDLGLESMN